jgi:hypothetical protein
MLANRQGYATITHRILGIKDMDAAEVANLNTPTKWSEDTVALFVETLFPFGLGPAMVAISHTGARIFLDESSLTAAAIKTIKGRLGNEKKA